VNERLQKLLAQANYGSRRTAETMIEQGRVRINGKIAKLGDQADLAKDVVEVDGKRLKPDGDPKIYIALNKPKNVVSTNIGHRGDDRTTVRELIPMEGHLFTIGRLDADSEGLIVLTNDGELANRLSHPRYQHTKTYRVVVQGLPTAESLEKWQNGMFMSEEEGESGPAFVSITKGSKDFSTLKVVMTEGKRRQIRRIAQMVGHPVKHLLRTHIGMLELGTLAPGEWRELSAHDVKMLSSAAPELKFIRERKRKVRRYVPRGAQPGAESRSPRSTGDSTREGGRKSTPSGRPSESREAASGETRPKRRPAARTNATGDGSPETDRKPMRSRKPSTPSTRGGSTSATDDTRKPRTTNRPAPPGSATSEGSAEADRKPARPRRPAAPAARSDERSPERKPGSNRSTPKPARRTSRPLRKRGSKPGR
jgi:23S rRNA pseudouridine2605 synthase